MNQNNNSQKSKHWYTKWWVISLFVLFGLPTILGIATAIITGTPTSKNKESVGSAEQKQVSTQPRDPVELNVNVQHDNLNVIIQNNESKDLGNCKLKLNDKYVYDATNRYLVNAGQEVKIGLSNFTENDGTRFNIYSTKPKYLRIDCDRKDGNSGSADIFWN